MDFTPEKAKVIEAIEKLGRKVTQADVSRSTGLPILEVGCELNRIAYDTGGRLLVSREGEMLYQFPKGFQRVYRSAPIWQFLKEVMGAIWWLAKHAFKVSFGILLIISLLSIIIFINLLAMAAQLLAALGGDSGDGGIFIDPSPVLALLFLDYSNDFKSSGDGKKNFLMDCYLYVFGPPNPNLDLEERKWLAVSELIKNNHGVLTAEQLIPFMRQEFSDETHVLPVLVRFDGIPEVTDNGNVVYVFPKMAYTAEKTELNEDVIDARASEESELETSDHSIRELSEQLDKSGIDWFQGINVGTKEIAPPIAPAAEQADQPDQPITISESDYLSEKYWGFTGIGFFESVLMFILGLANLAGMYFLFIFSAGVLLTPWGLYVSLLFLYAVFFVLYPIGRIHIAMIRNLFISARNSKYARYAASLKKPNEDLILKLQEAVRYRCSERVLTEKESVFDSDRDALEQEIAEECG